MKYKLYKNKKEINFNELKTSRRFKRDNETALKTRRFFTRWRFQTRIKRVYIRRFFKPGPIKLIKFNINKKLNSFYLNKEFIGYAFVYGYG